MVEYSLSTPPSTIRFTATAGCTVFILATMLWTRHSSLITRHKQCPWYCFGCDLQPFTCHVHYCEFRRILLVYFHGNKYHWWSHKRTVGLRQKWRVFSFNDSDRLQRQSAQDAAIYMKQQTVSDSWRIHTTATQVVRREIRLTLTK